MEQKLTICIWGPWIAVSCISKKLKSRATAQMFLRKMHVQLVFELHLKAILLTEGFSCVILNLQTSIGWHGRWYNYHPVLQVFTILLAALLVARIWTAHECLEHGNELELLSKWSSNSDWAGRNLDLQADGQALGDGGLEKEVPLVITADSRFDDVQAVFGRAGLAATHSPGSGANNPFARTLIHGYKGVAFEVMRNGYLASITLFCC